MGFNSAFKGLIKRKLKYLARFEVPAEVWLRMNVFWVMG